MYYAKELSIGAARENGFNLYTVKLYNLDSFVNWDESTPLDVVDNIIRKLMRMDQEELVEQIQTEYEEYGTMWEMRNMYDVLTNLLGDKKKTSEFLVLCGVGGVVAVAPKGRIYSVYDDSLIKILDVTKIR